VSKIPDNAPVLQILTVTFPFFALVLCGFVAARRGMLPMAAIPGLNSFEGVFDLEQLAARTECRQRKRVSGFACHSSELGKQIKADRESPSSEAVSCRALRRAPVTQECGGVPQQVWRRETQLLRDNKSNCYISPAYLFGSNDVVKVYLLVVLFARLSLPQKDRPWFLKGGVFAFPTDIPHSAR